MQYKIKICGVTNGDDAALAARCGANFIGLVCEIGYSARCVSRGKAAEMVQQSSLPVVLLLDKPAAEICEIVPMVRPNSLQLIGDHTPHELSMIREATGCRIWHPLRLPVTAARDNVIDGLLERLHELERLGVDTIVLDTLVAGMKGGTGMTCDWDLAARLVAASPLPVFLAGGISPENAADAITRVNPAGLDVSSGVETAPGKKDPLKIETLVRQVRTAELDRQEQLKR